MGDEPRARLAFEALERAVDWSAYERELRALGPFSPDKSSAPAEPPAADLALRQRLLLTDILDGSILEARQGDASFPLRILLSDLSTELDSDVGWDLSILLNAYFRTRSSEETKLRLGLECSRAYYAFAAVRGYERGTMSTLSKLVASMLSTELTRIRFDVVDHLSLFDSSLMERVAASTQSNSALRAPITFLVRVSQTGAVRLKAEVLT